jgi:hypothetical protein
MRPISSVQDILLQRASSANNGPAISAKAATKINVFGNCLGRELLIMSYSNVWLVGWFKRFAVGRFEIHFRVPRKLDVFRSNHTDSSITTRVPKPQKRIALSCKAGPNLGPYLHRLVPEARGSRGGKRALSASMRCYTSRGKVRLETDVSPSRIPTPAPRPTVLLHTDLFFFRSRGSL